MKILITGGAGYIGATIASAAADAGHAAIVLDDLSTGVRAYAQDHPLYEGDIADAALFDAICRDHAGIDLVIHCAARTVVPESVADPLSYYDVNIGRTLGLLESMRRNDVPRIIFSSSASVYAADTGEGLDEASPLRPSSPYARTKAIAEGIIDDVARAGLVRGLSLRYFNPIGTDPLGRTGPTAARPTHVLGRLVEAWATGETFTVTGTDWPTRDGSGVRDFIHVWDLARAHVRAAERFDDVVGADTPHRVLNLGTGRSTTVLELVGMFQRVVGGGLRVDHGPRRAGDVAGGYAIVDLAHALLAWRSELSIEDGIRDMIAWRRDHPPAE